MELSASESERSADNVQGMELSASDADSGNEMGAGDVAGVREYSRGMSGLWKMGHGTPDTRGNGITIIVSIIMLFAIMNIIVVVIISNINSICIIISIIIVVVITAIIIDMFISTIIVVITTCIVINNSIVMATASDPYPYPLFWLEHWGQRGKDYYYVPFVDGTAGGGAQPRRSVANQRCQAPNQGCRGTAPLRCCKTHRRSHREGLRCEAQSHHCTSPSQSHRGKVRHGATR